MTSNLDTYRTALDYLERHGDTAPIFAAMEADRLLDAGHPDPGPHLGAATTWRRVVKAVREMMEGTRH